MQFDEIHALFDYISGEMAKLGYSLKSIGGWPKTLHAEDYDGVKYLIRRRAKHFEVLIKTGIKLPLM